MTEKFALWVFPLASLCLPGLGQLLQRRTARGVTQLAGAIILSFTGILLLTIVVYSAWDAYQYERDLELPEAQLSEAEWRRIYYRRNNITKRYGREHWERLEQGHRNPDNR